MMMLSRASLAAVKRVCSRVHVYRTFTSTTALGDQYDVVVIGAFFLVFSIVARHLCVVVVIVRSPIT
jgi:hypothetical protein